MKEMNIEYPVIYVEVPHQMPVFSRVLENRGQLVELAIANAKENYPWSYLDEISEDGEYNGKGEADCPDDELWDAIRHNMHICYLISEADWREGWDPRSHHQASSARRQATELARGLGWEPEEEDDDETD